jgi:hypothetical protein
MKIINELLNDFYQKQKKFGYLQSLNLSRSISDEGCSEYSLNITLFDYPYNEGDQKLVLTFLGVRDFKIGNLEGLLKLLITIRDISDDQLEKINYAVLEEENELLKFYCEEFDFRVIDS